MATIDQIQIPSGTYDFIEKSFYGTCATAAATAAKVVTLSNAVGWSLVPGVIVGVKFTYTNSAGSVTLNVNGSGAKSIYYANAVYTGKAAQITGYANYIIYYMYDGSNWVFLNQSGNYIDSNTDNKVAQTATTTSANYEVLFSATADNTTRTEEARKNSNLLFNPSTGNLQATQLNGVTIGSSPKFTDTTYSSQAAASGGTAVSLVTTGEKYTWNNKSNLAIGTTATTAAAGNHTHTTSLAADSGTSSISLAANTKYKLTAGGTSVIFTTPVDTNTWRGIQNNLTSDSTTDSLAAAQGKALANGSARDNSKEFSYKVGTQATSNRKVQISINSNKAWMLSFVVTLYSSYRSTKVMISGYNYLVSNQYWYKPKAVIIGDSDESTINVYFGYTSVGNLWVGFDGGQYNGVSITDVTNGYTQVDNFEGLFTINAEVSTFTGTVQSTVSASNPYINTTYESKAAASGGTAVSLVTTGEKYTWNNKSNLAIGTTATTAAAGNHTHATSIAASSGTNQLTLAASTKYALTAGGTSYIFTTPPNSDTKNTAGSTDTSSKIFLIGATSQAANPQTYSDNEVYATNGVLTTKSVQVGGTAATIQYNSTTKSIDFVFA